MYNYSDDKYFLLKLEEEYGYKGAVIIANYIKKKKLYKIKKVYIGSYQGIISENDIITESYNYQKEKYKSIEAIKEDNEISDFRIIYLELYQLLFKNGYDPNGLIEIFKGADSGFFYLPSKSLIENYIMFGDVFFLKLVYKLSNKAIAKMMNKSLETIYKLLNEPITKGTEELKMKMFKILEYESDIVENKCFNMVMSRCSNCQKTYLVEDYDKKDGIKYKMTKKDIEYVMQTLNNMKEELERKGEKNINKKIRREKRKLLKGYKMVNTKSKTVK